MRLMSFIFIFISLACIRCVSPGASEAELSAYVLDPDNGLCDSRTEGSIRIQATYRPKDMLLVQQVKGGTVSAAQIDSIRHQISQYEYFSLRLSKNGRELPAEFVHDPAKFNSIVDYLSFEIGNDLRLVADGDTMRVADFVHTRTFGVSTASEVLAAFRYQIPNEVSSLVLVFDDPLFKTGLSEFRFQTKSIHSIPTLDLKQ